MLVSETALHLGPELERAVNRVDFFRLFKSLAGSNGFSYFGLTEIAGEEHGLSFQHVHALHNFPGVWFDDPKDPVIGAADPVARYLHKASAPYLMDIRQTPSPVLLSSGASAAVIVPLHAATGKRYGLIMVGGDAKEDHQALALIALVVAVAGSPRMRASSAHRKRAVSVPASPAGTSAVGGLISTGAICDSVRLAGAGSVSGQPMALSALKP